MKIPMRVCGGFLAALGLASSASAQPAAGPGCAAPTPCLPAPGAAPSPYQPSNTGENNPAQPPAPAPAPSPSGSSFASEGGFQGGLFESTLTAAGTGLASATATGGGVNAIAGTQSASSPLILPGLFTASQTEAARPMDRVFFDYGYFDSFQITRTALAPAGNSLFQPRVGFGFNLNRYDFGVEKTFFDGRASAIVRVPVLDATNNVSGQPIDGFGDIDAGFKVALLLDPCSGSALSAGLDVDAPTGRDQRFTIVRTSTNGGPFVSTSSTTVNPTFLQPYLVGSLNRDGLFVQDFLGVIVSTDGRISPFINEDLSVGYQLYRCPERMLSSITPTIEAQLLVPTAHEGSGGGFVGPLQPSSVVAPTTVSAFNFPDQLFLTEGVQLGLGERSVLSFGVVEPLAGPRAFTIGVTAGFNFFY